MGVAHFLLYTLDIQHFIIQVFILFFLAFSSGGYKAISLLTAAIPLQTG